MEHAGTYEIGVFPASHALACKTADVGGISPDQIFAGDKRRCDAEGAVRTGVDLKCPLQAVHRPGNYRHVLLQVEGYDHSFSVIVK